METHNILDTQQADPDRQKLIRLIGFLQQIASLRTKPIRDIKVYEKVLWISSIPHERGCFTQAWGRDGGYEPEIWLEVQSQSEPPLPLVPELCEDWIDRNSLRNKDDIPELLSQITRRISNPDWHENSDQPETIPCIEQLEDYPEVQKAWDHYVEDKWLAWTEEHSVWKKIHDVYSALFTFHQQLLRLNEDYELVLGLGLLTCKTPTGQRVRRHLVVADAILEFEARLGKFTVRPHTEGAKLRPELDMLDIADQPPRAEETAKDSLAAADDDPWEKGCVEGVLQALVHSMNAQGAYSDALEADTNIRASAKPIVEYAPALILRKRSAKSLTETLQRIEQQIQDGEAVPEEFVDIAEARPNGNRAPSDEPRETSVVFDGETFFPKPSNKEQRRIVDKIRGGGGVLVQGPPGTGKSHTIANLICHLLATGQRTLITAKTPRALQVLEWLLPEELRPLCVNLLGSGLEERRSLEASVGGILRKNEVWDEDQAKNERLELAERLQDLREERVQVDQRLRDIRESETYPQSIAEGTYRGTAARIAEAVNRDRADYEWFTDTVPLHNTCPVSTNDLRSILKALRHFTPEKRGELSLAWPEGLLSPGQFADLVKNETNALDKERLSTSGADPQLADLLSRNNPELIEALRSSFSLFLSSYTSLLITPHSWMKEALRDILGGSSSLWHARLHVTQDVIASIHGLVSLADETPIEFPDSTDIRTLYEDARKLQEHMENGGKLGWVLFRPKPVQERLYVINTVKIGGHPCSTLEHFTTLADALQVRLACEKAWDFWQGQCEKTEGPYALQLGSFESLQSALEPALALEEAMHQCREAIRRCPGMADAVWADESQIKSIVFSCDLALARIHKRIVTEEIQTTEAPIARMVEEDSVHPVTSAVLSAIRNRDMDRFAQCTNTIQDLEKQRHLLQQVDTYLSKLRSSLPQLVASLEQTCKEPYWEERIERLTDAWHWAQARYWIEEYIRQEDVPALAMRSKQIEDAINNSIAKLASLHAWSFCFSRLEESHRRHMEAWKQSMRKLGKGTGKHATHHRRVAQEHLNACREAVPAWVMPLHRVWDTISAAPGIFDVIIVDEASQCGLEALPLFYLGKKLVIVGDDKQISPEAVGVNQDEAIQLQKQFLDDYEHKSSFDIASSLFDHGKLRYGTRRITLQEHFRCMPEIIRFSNDLCYSETPLIPLRQYGPDRLPPLEHVFVNNGYREGSGSQTINRLEAEAIVERIAAMCNDSRYEGKTMGVVVLQGEAQAALIENQLLERLGAEEWGRRRLLCGKPYSFQGDERDIIFLSLVAAGNERIGSLNKSADERRFNVAASRARDMMILFHSVTSDDLSVFDLRRKLLEFFEGTKPQQIAGIDWDELERRAAQDNRQIVKPPPPFDSWFEIDVALELLRKGFTVLSQHEVAGKKIDLVVEGGLARLAVECDGDHWHGVDQYEADMQRQRQLERCGWEFFRVRESAFYSNKENALSRLWQMLEERNIFPNARSADALIDNKEAEASVDEFDDRTAKDDGLDDDGCSPADSEGDFSPSGRRAEEIAAKEIREAILSALSECPNQTCTLHSVTSRVLKEVGVRTRGKPRLEFERRVMQSVDYLEKCKRLEKYRAKNERIRLIKQISLIE